MWRSESGQEAAAASSSEEEPVDDAPPASPFSYAELEDKLKQVTPGWTAIKPSAKIMIYVFAFLVCVSAGEGPPQMAQQHDLFTHLLQTIRRPSPLGQEIENQLVRRRVYKNQLRAAYMRRKVRRP
ncbi:hypothetical protein AAG906_009561 [Vitis piasezkii]